MVGVGVKRVERKGEGGRALGEWCVEVVYLLLGRWC